MNIIPQISMFGDSEFEELGDLERLQAVLGALPDGKLIRALYRIRGQGRNDWPCEAMWNTFVASFLFEHSSVEALLRELRRNKQLRDICGIKPITRVQSDGKIKRYVAPSGSAYSKFLTNLVACKEELKEMFESLVQYMYDHLDDFVFLHRLPETVRNGNGYTTSEVELSGSMAGLTETTSLRSIPSADWQRWTCSLP